MKNLVIIVLVMLFCCGPLFAQNEKKPIYYFNTGVSFPSSPELFSRYWKPGPNLGLGIGYQTSASIVLQMSFVYSNMPFNGEKLLQDYGMSGLGLEVSGGSAKVITASGDFKAYLAPMDAGTAPYFIVGAGLFRISASDAMVSYQGGSQAVQGNSESAIGIGVGVGIDFRLRDRLTLFVEGKYALGFTDVDNTLLVPLKLGFAFR
jgi:opacity protein-like surface antigen